MEVGGNGNVDPFPKEKTDNVTEVIPRKDPVDSSETRRDPSGDEATDAPVSMDTSEASGQDTKSRTDDVVIVNMFVNNSGVGGGGTTPGSGGVSGSPNGNDNGEFERTCKEAYAAIQANKTLGAAKSCVGTLQKLLLTVQKTPDKLSARKHRLDNIAIKKFVVDVKGALEFMKAVGFHETKIDGGHSYLLMEDGVYDARKVDFALNLLTSPPPTSPQAQEPKKAAAKTLCLGGCGFWGDETQENYCSLCFKKKVCGVSTTTTSTATSTASTTPVKCVNKCGFFGAKQYDGMCSVCFTKTGGVKKAPLPGVKMWRKKLRRAMLKLRCVRAFASAPRVLQKNKTRCWQCNKKVGITGIDCKCGFIFCGIHRYPSEHSCHFDHKARHQQTLRKNNLQIVSKKFDTIED